MAAKDEGAHTHAVELDGDAAGRQRQSIKGDGAGGPGFQQGFVLSLHEGVVAAEGHLVGEVHAIKASEFATEVFDGDQQGLGQAPGEGGPPLPHESPAGGDRHGREAIVVDNGGHGSGRRR
jgi:hypothetical protein